VGAALGHAQMQQQVQQVQPLLPLQQQQQVKCSGNS
jgi:hypothetical protein